MPLFFRQLAGELRKIFSRKRTYIGFGAYLLIEMLVLALFQLPRVKNGLRHHIENQGFAPDLYFSGLTLSFIVVSSTVLLVGALFLALIGGDAVATEVDDGTMRLILSRPVSRFRVVCVRYLAVIAYTFTLMVFIAGSALLVGLAKQGAGGMFVYAPSQRILALFDFNDGLSRYLMSIPLMTLSFITVASLGFLFSCCNMKPVAATVLCFALYLIDMIFQGLPQFESIREWFLTTHMFTWMKIYHPLVPVWEMVEDYAYLAGIDGTLFVVGWLIFQGRDFKA